MKVLCFLAVIVTAAAQDSPALEELIDGNLHFSAKTYKELAKENSGNFLVCPLSVQVVFALVEAGAGEETARQIIAGLNLPESDTKIQTAFRAIARELNVQGVYQLASANKVYVKNDYGLNPNFKDIATHVFNADVQEIDFTSANIATNINNWVAKKTHDNIKDLVSSNDFDSDTRLVLINALYFHGLWINRFQQANTKQKAFHINSREEINVKMMEQTSVFRYYRDEQLKAKFLEMDYHGSPISITFVLPDDIDGLPTLESNIDKVLIRPQFANTKVHVQLPHVNIEHKIDFKPLLQQFGVKDAFESSANLTGIAASGERLKISKVVQKAFIAIEERGTTAAAATAKFTIPMSGIEYLKIQPLQEFEANHPFIFILRSSHGIFFVGRYVNPNN